MGEDDEGGAANMVDNAKRLAALRLVERGWAISLSRPIALQPNVDELFNLTRYFVQHREGVAFDYLVLPIHHGTHLTP